MATAWRDRLGRLGQWSWIAGWCWLLWLVVRPWNELGGIVSERLRWCEHAGCGLGLIVGYTAGDLARLGGGHCGRRGHRARWLLYPALTVALLAVAWLRGSGRDDAIGVAFTGWLAYTAGASTGLLGYPLENCAKTMLTEIIDYTFEDLKHLRTVVLYLASDLESQAFRDEFERHIHELQETGEGQIKV